MGIRLIFLAPMALFLLTPSSARAWGVAHVGYTHVDYGGAYHVGRTVGYEGDRGYSTARYSTYDRYGRTSYGGYHYSPSYDEAVREEYLRREEAVREEYLRRFRRY